MPLLKKVVYSRPVWLDSGHITLALFDRDNNLIEYRICEYNERLKRFICPRDKTKRRNLAYKIGIDPNTNMPI